jgi:rhamnose utilization protein RhaD (predicted bifunctional aldolase and dehydrogenase)
MKNLWSDIEARSYTTDLGLRVYTSNLLGKSDELVLHGGGNTSVKSEVDDEDILYVKGSGWDLVSIKEEGFAPVKLEALWEMARRESLSDSEMVALQKAAMIDKDAPNPSVEAILHAIIPFKFVDHTHADAVVTISNSVDGVKLIKELYPNFLIIPYVMPGFILAHTIYKKTKELDWSKCEGIILHNHGIFTFDDEAKASYTKMIDAVTKAEKFLKENASVTLKLAHTTKHVDLKKLHHVISEHKGFDAALHVNRSNLAYTYATHENLQSFACRGVLTPEHIIRTKRKPLILDGNNFEEAVLEYEKWYEEYFENFATQDMICLNPAPNYAVIKDFGIITFGKNEKEASIINDIVEHTMLATLRADMLGGYKSISITDSFEMEYWELEQAKLRK